MEEIILIILLGFSPSGATDAAFKVLEYKQPSMVLYKKRRDTINDITSLYKFTNPKAICVGRLKSNRKSS